MAATENSDLSLETMPTLTNDYATYGDSSPSDATYTDAFKSLQKYVESISNNDAISDDAFTCRLIPYNTGIIGEKRSKDEIASFYRTKGENNNATIVEINTLIFRPTVVNDKPNNCDIYAVAIVPSSNKVDIRAFSEELLRLQQQQQQNQEQFCEGENKDETNGSSDHTCYQNWELAPSHLVRDLCEFSPGAVPPLLVPPRGTGMIDNSRREKDKRKPLAVVVDSSLLGSHNASNSTTKNENNKLLLLGGGGNIDHLCLIDAEFLMDHVFQTNANSSSNNPSNSNNVRIASIIRFEGGMTTNAMATRSEGPSESKLRTASDAKNDENKKPFFQIAPPSTSIHYDTMARPEPERPHRPVPVTAIGRITSVRQIAKRLVFADFAPPDYDYSSWLMNKNVPNENALEPNYDKNQGGMPGPPWRSGEDGKDMYVQIIVGKTFCERYDDGTERLKSLKPGKLVLLKGAANVDPMQKNGWRNSAGNWAQKRSLDVIVSSFEILDEDEDDDNLRLLMDEAKNERTSNGNWNNLLPWERKRGYERRAVAGNNGFASGSNAQENGKNSPSLMLSSNNHGDANGLTLDRFNSVFRDSPLEIEIVDADESIGIMAKEISELFSQIENNGKQKSDFLDYVAGIDCEWRPTGAYAEALLEGPDDNPVALLQICIPAIGKVYLVDTHQTLRANLADTEQMNANEEILSKTIGTLFGSEGMIKVGYSVIIDFRRLAASFPHIPAFRNVRSVVELSTLAQRLHPKSAHPSLGSLQRLTKLVLGYNITKEQQCSNWEARPLTSNQVEYAALDCALPPRLLDQMTEGSGTAKMKQVLPQVTSSWKFQTLDSDQKDAIQLLKAKRVVGNTFLVSQNWLQDRDAPATISIPKEGGGPYVDKSGMLKMPANLVSVAGGGEDAPWKKMAGKTVGKSKGKCINLLIGNSLPEGANLEYNPRSGFITFKDGLALFVNMPDPNGPSRRMPYPNEWLEDGKILTWYIRPKDWDDGRSKTAKLLSGLGDSDSAGNRPSVILFTRIGNGEFVCCGNCKASVADKTNAGGSNKKLVKLDLHLEDWETMKNLAVFSQLLETKKSRNNASSLQGQVFDPVSFRNGLARMVLDGNMIGAFGAALDRANVSATERSIVNGVKWVKSYLSNSDDPFSLQAMAIIEDMT